MNTILEKKGIRIEKEKGKLSIVLLIITIFAVAINMRPAITSIGPMLDIIRQDLSLTNAHVTMLTALPVICMGVFASLAPVLNRRLGLNKTMLLMLLMIGMMTALRGLISNYITLILSAVMAGVGIAIIGPLLSALIKQRFPEKAGVMVGVYSFGMGVGATLSGGLTAYFYDSTGSYPFALGIWSVLSVFGILFWFITMDRSTVVKQRYGNGPGATIMGSPWRNKKAWVFLFFFGLQASSFFSIVTWLVPIATSKGMALVTAGTLLSLMTTVQIVMNITFPVLMERFATRKFWLLLLSVVGLAAIGLLWTGNHSLMWAGAFLMGIPLGGLFPVALLLPLDETKTAEDTNAMTAMMQTGGFIMAGFLPLLIAIIVDWSGGDHTSTFIIFTALFLSMFFLTFLIGNKTKVQS